MAYNKATATKLRTRVALDDNMFPRLVWIPQGDFRGHRPIVANKGRHKTFTASVVTDNAWHRARVTCNGKAIYTGKPTRDRAEALGLAQTVMANARRRLGQ
jgi:hypothetical protein